MKKLNYNLIYLLSGLICAVTAIVAVIKGDIVLANTYLILSILLYDKYKDRRFYASMKGHDVHLILDRDRHKRN